MIWLLQARDIPEAALLPYLPRLDAARQQRIARFRVPHSRVESCLAGLLLRYAYGQEYGGPLPALATAQHGKPEFAGRAAPQFNLSHWSRDGQYAVACALSRQPVGADGQGLHRYEEKFRRILSDAERAWVEESDSDARFTALWTRKEAYGKALGCGIGYEMQKTELSGSFETPTAYMDWLLWTTAADGLFVSVCAREALACRVVNLQTLLTALSGGEA